MTPLPIVTRVPVAAADAGIAVPLDAPDVVLGHDDVEVAVRVHVGDLHVGGEVGAGRDRVAVPGRRLVPDELGVGADDDVGQLVAVDVADRLVVEVAGEVGVDDDVLEGHRRRRVVAPEMDVPGAS